jgi:hypothetical protein
VLGEKYSKEASVKFPKTKEFVLFPVISTVHYLTIAGRRNA